MGLDRAARRLQARKDAIYDPVRDATETDPELEARIQEETRKGAVRCNEHPFETSCEPFCSMSAFASVLEAEPEVLPPCEFSCRCECLRTVRQCHEHVRMRFIKIPEGRPNGSVVASPLNSPAYATAPRGPTAFEPPAALGPMKSGDESRPCCR